MILPLILFIGTILVGVILVISISLLKGSLYIVVDFIVQIMSLFVSIGLLLVGLGFLTGYFFIWRNFEIISNLKVT